MSRQSRTTKTVFVTIAAVMIVAMVFDAICSRFSWDYGGSFYVWYSALEWPATINTLLREVWFAQCLGLVILPVILWRINRRTDKQRRVWPWLLVASVLTLDWIVTMLHSYHAEHVTPFADFSNYIHMGPQFFVPVYNSMAIDTTLQSTFPYFLVNEACLLSIVIIIFVARHDARRYRARGR